MNLIWPEAASEYWEKTWPHEGRLSSLPEEWQRELVALYRLGNDVNNGGYLQFLANNGRDYYVYASQLLKKISAVKTAAVIDSCQALIDEHCPTETASSGDLNALIPNQIIDREGNTIKDVGSVLPDSVLVRISELSYEFMGFPEDYGNLAEDYFRPYLEADRRRGEP